MKIHTINELESLNKWENALSSPHEHMWVLIGEYDEDLWYGRMYPMAVGSPTLVSFDAKKVLKQEELHHNVIGFFHTHPSFSAFYSQRDDATMKQWVNCFGKPLVCCIKGTDGLRAWWYIDDEIPPAEYQSKRVGKTIFGITPINENENVNPWSSFADFIRHQDSNFRPVEEFMPEDERQEWADYVKEIERTNRESGQ